MTREEMESILRSMGEPVPVPGQNPLPGAIAPFNDGGKPTLNAEVDLLKRLITVEISDEKFRELYDDAITSGLNGMAMHLDAYDSDPDCRRAILDLQAWALKNVTKLDEFDSLNKRWRTEKEEPEYIIHLPFYNITGRLLNALYNAAESGDRDAIYYMTEVYSRIWRDEYSWLKRQRKLELGNMLNYDRNLTDEAEFDDLMCRFIAMAKVMGIETDPTIDQFVRGRKLHVTHIERETIAFRPDKYMDRGRELTEPLQEKIIENATKYKKFLELLYVDAIAHDDPMSRRSKDPTELYAKLRSAGVKTTTPEILALAGVLETAAYGRQEATLHYSRAILSLLRMKTDEDREEEERVIGSAAKGKTVAGSREEKPAPEPEPVVQEEKEAEPEDETEDLRAKLNDTKEKLRLQYEKTGEVKAELESAREKYDDLVKYTRRLEHLVDILAEQDGEEQKPIEEIKEFLKTKSVCVIGGHENWIKKLRAMFPDWRFIRLNGFQMTDADKVLRGHDMNVMFTDHLDHCTYGKMMSVIRDNDLPLGYVTTVNLDKSLRQIYDAFLG